MRTIEADELRTSIQFSINELKFCVVNDDMVTHRTPKLVARSRNCKIDPLRHFVDPPQTLLHERQLHVWSLYDQKLTSPYDVDPVETTTKAMFQR